MCPSLLQDAVLNEVDSGTELDSQGEEETEDKEKKEEEKTEEDKKDEWLSLQLSVLSIDVLSLCKQMKSEHFSPITEDKVIEIHFHRKYTLILVAILQYEMLSC